MTEFIPFATKNSALKTCYSQFVTNCALKNRLRLHAICAKSQIVRKSQTTKSHKSKIAKKSQIAPKSQNTKSHKSQIARNRKLRAIRNLRKIARSNNRLRLRCDCEFSLSQSQFAPNLRKSQKSLHP